MFCLLYGAKVIKHDDISRISAEKVRRFSSYMINDGFRRQVKTRCARAQNFDLSQEKGCF
jgi:hypothetical protein